jgi:hypothetical protein
MGVQAFLEVLSSKHEVLLVTAGRRAQVRVPPIKGLGRDEILIARDRVRWCRTTGRSLAARVEGADVGECLTRQMIGSGLRGHETIDRARITDDDRGITPQPRCGGPKAGVAGGFNDRQDVSAVFAFAR